MAAAKGSGVASVYGRLCLYTSYRTRRKRKDKVDATVGRVGDFLPLLLSLYIQLYNHYYVACLICVWVFTRSFSKHEGTSEAAVKHNKIIYRNEEAFSTKF